MAMRWLREAGHRPVVLMGGGTARVGDPSGKDRTRELLDDARIEANLDGQRPQFGQVVGPLQQLSAADWAALAAGGVPANGEVVQSGSLLGEEAGERRRALARAKVQLGQSMRFVGQQAVQLHGGIGVTDEYIVSHYFKKLTQLEVTFGDTLHHLGEVSARMQDTAGVFA
jgi:alkylation response protein AidB-like acyl-CoA dehydrogenase